MYTGEKSPRKVTPLTHQNQIAELQKAMQETQDRRMFERYQAVFLCLSGYTQKAAADITGRSRRSINSYVTAYKKAGLAGLVRGKGSGKPKSLTDDQEKALETVIAEQLPSDVGFENRANWTLALAAQYVEREWGVSYSLKGMSIVLKRRGLSFTRPTYTLEKADPEKQRQFKEDTFPALKKLIFEEIDHLLFVDESMIRDYPAIGPTGFRKGQQRIIPTTGQHRGAKLIGSLDYETGEVLCIERETYDAQAFLEFLQTLRAHYSGEKIAIVLDNARIHHAELIQPFLEAHRDQLELVFLPPYSPQLNLIEGLWKWLKASVINNVFFPNVQKIKLAVRGFIQDINRHKETVIDRLCVQL
ncbi:IS630 family transposase [Salinicoccus sp. HZC-1]|uniref:IS630 family transposase n=1 Tax=Salinicoccus sp. HZC-1 TaxID=3385497 RepID=UPI00398B783F